MERMAGKRSSDDNTSSRSQSHLANFEETGFAGPRHAVTVCAGGQNEGRSTAGNPVDTKESARIVVPGYADPDVLDIRTDPPTACREAINVLLAIHAYRGREKWVLLTADVQAAFLKGELQDKDRVLFCWPPRNGVPGVQLGSLLLILKGVFGLNDAPRKWWEKISKVFVHIGFRKKQRDASWFVHVTLHCRCI